MINYLLNINNVELINAFNINIWCLKADTEYSDFHFEIIIREFLAKLNFFPKTFSLLNFQKSHSSFFELRNQFNLASLGLSIYSNAHAKVEKWIFPFWFPGNCFDFVIISNDLLSSTIWAVLISLSISEFKNPKKPGIQLTYGNSIFNR